MFLDFSLDPANTWPGNFRDLNAMVVRMATLADGGRITAELVEEEISRCAQAPSAHPGKSWEELENMRRCAEILLEKLGMRFEHTQYSTDDRFQTISFTVS